jgi:uncharacterized membrane protein
MRRNVNGLERAASVAAGAFLVAASSRARRPIAGVLGAGLVARGLSGYCPLNAALGRARTRDDTRAALGGSRGVLVTEAITVAVPRDEVYRFWRTLSNLPRFMSHLERVDVLGDNRSHWVAKAPVGMHVAWDAEIINEVEPEVIGWRSLPGADVASAGSVNFRNAPQSGTEIVVRLQYDPPAGRLGSWIAATFGEEPSQQIREDLRRLKQFLETGEAATVSGQPAGGGYRLQPEVG